MYSYALVYCFDERCGQNYSNLPGLFFPFGLGHFLAERCARCTHVYSSPLRPLFPSPSGGFTVPVSIVSFFRCRFSSSSLLLLSLPCRFCFALPRFSLLAIVPSRGVEFEIAIALRLFSQPMISSLCDPRGGIAILTTPCVVFSRLLD